MDFFGWLWTVLVVLGVLSLLAIPWWATRR
jgi:hypothetical protein